MAAIRRCFINAVGPDDDALRKALQWLVLTAKDEKTEGVIVTYAKGNAENLGRVLGEAATKQLLAGRQVNADGVLVSLVTARKGYSAVAGRVVLALWADDDVLAKLDDSWPKAICLVPWTDDDGGTWKATWAPVDIASGKAAPASAGLSPLTRAALRSLTSSVNLGTGLGHPSDRDAAIETFRILKNAGEQLDPDAIRAWAAKNGWQARGADEVAEIVRGVNAGKAFRTSGMKQYTDRILDIWRDDAAADANESN